MINIVYFLVPILVSFFVTLFLLPSWIKRAKSCDLTGIDVHKKNKIKVAEAGGVTVMAGFLLGTLVFIAINTFLVDSVENFIEILASLVVILSVSFIGLIDDILGWKIGLSKKLRMILVAFASIPLIAINAGKSDIGLPFLGTVDIGIFYPLFLIPLGIVGAATTFNFLAGYNGQEAGQGVLLLFAFALVSYLTGSVWLSIICFVMIGALLAFLLFNFSPAKVFPGDALTYMIETLIAIVAILGNFEKIAVFFFIPYIIEVVLKSRGGLEKESFGKLLDDGSLDLKHSKIYSLNHLSIYLMKKFGVKPTERRVVYSIWGLQFLVIVLGFLIFRGNLTV